MLHDAPLPRLLRLAVPIATLLQATLAASAPTLTIRASGSLAGNVGPIMEVRVDGAVVGTAEVRASQPASYSFPAGSLKPGARVEVVYVNDAVVNGRDRNLSIAYLQDGDITVLPTSSGAVFDRGAASRAFDGVDAIPGQHALNVNGALRLHWPGSAPASEPTAAQRSAARLLQQASFGPTAADIEQVAKLGTGPWLAQQLAMPWSPSFVRAVQRQYDLGDAYRPGGNKYTASWVGNHFWSKAANRPDQLRGRVAFALHQIFMVSQEETRIWSQSRGYAHYLDTLHQHAFGNYRELLEDMALSPMMGIYLSHMRNRKEDPATGLMPDENFAREVMQLFSIGLHELNPDGSLALGTDGKPVETYSNADVMAMAKVFTGWSWGLDDDQLTEKNFRWGRPSYRMAEDRKVDLRPMKPYPGQHSMAEKALFTGKPWAVTIPAGTSARDSLRLALDTLFHHPNVGPFIGRQLIQHLVTGNPSPGYVARVAAAFNDNGHGVRGDLAAVVRAILLDAEARGQPSAGLGKVREPVLRVSHWLRAFNATSASGQFAMASEPAGVGQKTFHAPSVFGYFRPGYVPPNTRFAETGATAPEFQIVDESSVTAWVNQVEAMVGGGLGFNGDARDVRSSFAPQVSLIAAGNADGLVQNLNLLLFAGQMSRMLQTAILDAMAGVSGKDAASHLNRVRVAVLVAMSSPEYLVQR